MTAVAIKAVSQLDIDHSSRKTTITTTMRSITAPFGSGVVAVELRSLEMALQSLAELVHHSHHPDWCCKRPCKRVLEDVLLVRSLPSEIDPEGGRQQQPHSVVGDGEMPEVPLHQHLHTDVNRREESHSEEKVLNLFDVVPHHCSFRTYVELAV